MPLKRRIVPALRAAAVHLLISVFFVMLAAALVLVLWYPTPFDMLAGGRKLMFMILIIDLVIGPLLTLVVFDPAKPKRALARDLSIIGLIQIIALGYGLLTAFNARPVYLAFEADAFRLVTSADISHEDLPKAPESLRSLSWQGPVPIGVQLLSPSDPNFAHNIELALNGYHSAFRPERWLPYASQVKQVTQKALPLSELRAKNPSASTETARVADRLHIPETELAYLPLLVREQTDWVVIINKKDGLPVAALQLNGW